jgi:hypothetical protein
MENDHGLLNKSALPRLADKMGLRERGRFWTSTHAVID